MIVQKLNLNLIPDDEVRVIHLNQYDKDRAALEFTIFRGSSYFNLTGCSVRIEGTKPDGKGYSYAGTVSGSVAKFDVSEQMTAAAGKYRAEVRIKKSTDDIGSANITFDIEPAGLSGNTDISETELPEIFELGRGYAQDAAESAALAQERAMVASDYAGEAADQADRAERLTIRTVTASVDAKTGTPSVDVTPTGDTEKNFHFAFHNIKGEKGDKGDQGIQGVKGDKGDKGDTGATGAKGDKGDQGIQGIQGIKGDKGDKGDPGVDGTVAFDDLTEEQRLSLKGEKGDTGPRGPQGIQGPKGDRGDAGDPATPTSLGSVKPDNDTILIASDGTLKASENRNLYRNLYTRYSIYSVGDTVSGVDFTHYPDGRVLVNGTAEAEIRYVIGTIDIPRGYDKAMYFRTNPAFEKYPTGFEVVIYNLRNDGGSYTYDDGQSRDAVMSGKNDSIISGIMYVWIKAGVTANNIMLYPLVSDSRIPQNYSYIPYGGHSARTMSNDFHDMQKMLLELSNSPCFNKNLIKLITKKETINGITFEINSFDGSIAVSGTATDDATCLIATGLKGKAGEIYRASLSSYAGAVRVTDNKGMLLLNNGENKYVTLAKPGGSETTLDIYLTVPKGTAVSYTSYIYLMITKGYVLDDKFRAYSEPVGTHKLKKTLPAGSPYVEFMSDDFSDDSIVDFYTSNGAQYTKTQLISGRYLRVYFPEQDEDIDVIVRW